MKNNVVDRVVKHIKELDPDASVDVSTITGDVLNIPLFKHVVGEYVSGISGYIVLSGSGLWKRLDFSPHPLWLDRTTVENELEKNVSDWDVLVIKEYAGHHKDGEYQDTAKFHVYTKSENEILYGILLFGTASSGTDFRTAFEDAKKMAKKLGGGIEYTFNSVKIQVFPDTKYEDVRAEYEEKLANK